MSDNLVVEVLYEDKFTEQKSAVVLECLGPNTVVGMVADIVHKHHTGEGNNKLININIGFVNDNGSMKL